MPRPAPPTSAATLDGSNNLVLTGTDAVTNITIGSGSTLSLLGELGLSAGTTNATNLLTQSAASAGQTLTFTVGSNAPLTITFGTGVGQVATMADLNTALAGLAGGIASADPLTGNITVTASNSTDTITVGGDATASNFGIHTPTALPSNGTVVANDVTTFLNESIAGGAVTAYDTSGSAVNIQLRWAKIDSSHARRRPYRYLESVLSDQFHRDRHPAGLAECRRQLHLRRQWPAQSQPSIRSPCRM